MDEIYRLNYRFRVNQIGYMDHVRCIHVGDVLIELWWLSKQIDERIDPSN